MYSRPGHLIGDAWYFIEDDTAHVYYLTSPDDAPPEERGHHWDIGHAVSDDLVSWEYVGLALRKGEPGAWDDKRLATGGVIKRDGRYWMSFTGHHLADQPNFQRVGMAVSDDLTNWEKTPENPVTVPDPQYYELVSTCPRGIVNWRDPFLLDTGDEVFHFVCARRADGDRKTRGSVGVARTRDMRNWEVLPPPEHDRIAHEFEVPQVYFINGRWYLVFCSHPVMLSDEFKARFSGQELRKADYSMVGESPIGPFHIHGTGEIVPMNFSPHVYASQLVQWKGEWLLLGTIVGGEAISDPIPIEAGETGLHIVT